MQNSKCLTCNYECVRTHLKGCNSIKKISSSIVFKIISQEEDGEGRGERGESAGCISLCCDKKAAEGGKVLFLF